MYYIECKEFRSYAYENQELRELGRRLAYIEDMQYTYGFDHSIKESFHLLLKEGFCSVLNEERAELIMHILDREGYNYDMVS